MIAILQPHIPHYRHEFFSGLQKENSIDFYCYEKQTRVVKNNFKTSNFKTNKISSILFEPFLCYNPFTLLKSKYSTIVLMLNFAHITTWILLLTKFIHRKNIILYGHGISVKRYLEESKRPHKLLKWMIVFSNGVWLYTDAELKIWQKVFPQKKMVALNNTISDVDKILTLPTADKSSLKSKYNITQEIIFIFCARFNNPHRRIDLLIQVIEKLDAAKFAFIIIGDGKLKPDFSKYHNVYDFNAVYEREIKDNLFQLADIYLQPAWVGLSIAEAMAYGKPIFTMNRTDELLQCVEYSYIINGENGLIFQNVEDLVKQVSAQDILIKSMIMGKNAKAYATKNLRMLQMIINANSILNNL